MPGPAFDVGFAYDDADSYLARISADLDADSLAGERADDDAMP
jgi:hypothetical protein